MPKACVVMRVTVGSSVTPSVSSAAVSLSELPNLYQLRRCRFIYLTLCQGENSAFPKKINMYMALTHTAYIWFNYIQTLEDCKEVRKL